MTAAQGVQINWTRLIAMLTGVGLFFLVYFSPPWPDAIDPVGKHFALTPEGKGAVALFLMAGIWWVFEVVPIGVTSLVIGVMQALFMIRPAKVAFKDFMDPSVLFIFASLVIGMVFTKTGLTKRMAYKMLNVIGENTGSIYLGVFLLITVLTLIMAHTAVAATMYPLLLAIYSLYGTRKEIISLVIIFGAIVTMSLQVMVPKLQSLDKTAIILVSTILFFVFNILDIEDLELIPWNIVLLFSGAMSIGYCLWETEAAKWMAVNWLALFQKSHWLVFVLSIAFFVMILTNFIMNVAAIAISLPVALVIAGYLGVSSYVVMYAALVTAGMPFILLVGAAPNTIAYDSKQFTSGEFFMYGIPASLILMLVVALAVLVIWPLLGMPITVPRTM